MGNIDEARFTEILYGGRKIGRPEVKGKGVKKDLKFQESEMSD